MNSSSPANSSISTTAIVGGGASASNAALEEFQFPSDLISIQDRKDEAMLGLFCFFHCWGFLNPSCLDYAFLCVCKVWAFSHFWVILFLHQVLGFDYIFGIL